MLLETGRLHYRGPDGNGPAEVWDCTDTPGTYSLLPLSPDEKVAADAVMGAEGLPRPDLVVAVLDATNIARSLYFLAMVVELGAPTVVALTMNDLAEAQGCGVDAERLSALLDGLPVVAVDGRTGAGTDRLVRTIADGFRGTPVPEGLHPLTGTANVRAWVEDHADARFDWAARIIRGLDLQMRDRVTLSDRIDRVLLHPVLGIVMFLAVMYLVFQATTTLAGPMQDWFDVTVRGWLAAMVDTVFSWFGPAASTGWAHALVVDGVLDGVVTVLTFIPPMGIMFLLLSLLEDSGYLARAAFVMDRAMRTIGLDGRAFLPIIVGFGCNLPALAATRTLPDSRQRVLTGMLIPFSSCSAHLSVYLVLAYAFFRGHAGSVVFLMYVLSVAVILLVGLLLRHTKFRGLKPEPFAMSLPPYQCPRLVMLIRSVLGRLWGFVRGASSVYRDDDCGAVGVARHPGDARSRVVRPSRGRARFGVRRGGRRGRSGVHAGGIRRLACLGRADHRIRGQGGLWSARCRSRTTSPAGMTQRNSGRARGRWAHGCANPSTPPPAGMAGRPRRRSCCSYSPIRRVWRRWPN